MRKRNAITRKTNLPPGSWDAANLLFPRPDMTVHIEINDEIAVVTIDNPPVNAINRAIRQGLMDAMDLALSKNVARIIITAIGRTFVAGADAKEFDAPPQEPHLNDVLNRLSSFSIPVVAAINGMALGGGLEIALASRYRIASRSATLGLPEVTLGIVPGSGATQRLPRLIGVAAAVDMISNGKAIDANKAKAIGLIDAISDDPLAAAHFMDSAALLAAVPIDRLPMPAGDDAAIASATAQVEKRAPNQIAPRKAIELVAASSRLEIEVGLLKEREIFLDLRGSDQARALRHVFFAERAASSQANQFPKPDKAIASAIVVGGGNMGASIAYALASSGLVVTVIETDDDALLRAKSNVSRIISQAVSRGLMTEDTAKSVASSIKFRVGYENLAPADLAIEAAFEDMEVKQAIFDALAANLPSNTILATNTSYLDIDELARSIQHPDRFLGLHFFSPAHIMKLLEIVRGKLTSSVTIGAAFSLARALKKVPVLSGVCDGFIGNRILSRYRHAADLLLVEGCSPRDVDMAMRNFGMAMGPYEAQDMSGLDIGYANRKRQNLRSRRDIRYVPLVERLVEEDGRLGRKSGAGWYDYDGDRPTPSAAVSVQLSRVSLDADLVRREIPEKEIQDRLLLSMIAEATAILDEGIAECPRDVDLVLIHGYGFPRWRGGLMQHADTIGLDRIVREIKSLSDRDPLSWSTPNLLLKLAAEGKTFASQNSAQKIER
jgi:3-hydroxyacyl-CoA dehydrogenase